MDFLKWQETQLNTSIHRLHRKINPLILLIALFLYLGQGLQAQTFEKKIEQIKIKLKEEERCSIEEIEELISDRPDDRFLAELYVLRFYAYELSSNYILALRDLEKAEKYANTYDIKFEIYSNAGTIYLTLDNLESALDYFGRALKLAKEHHDIEDIGFAEESIFHVKIAKNGKEYIKKYEKYLNTRDKDPSPERRFYNMIELGTNYLSYEMYDDLERVLDAHPINIKSIENKVSSTDIPIYYQLKAEISLEDKDGEAALSYLDSASKGLIIEKDLYYMQREEAYHLLGDHENRALYLDSLSRYMESIASEVNKMGSVYVNKLSKDKTSLKQLSLIQWIFLALASLLLSLAILWGSKQYRKKNLLRRDKSFIKKKYQKLWTTYQLSNNQLSKLRDQLNQQSRNKELNKVNRLSIEILQLLDESNEDIHKHINLAQTDFIQKIESEAPFLTEMENLVCYFIALKLPHRKIAAVLNKSEKSIDSYKYRIKKKFSTYKHQDFEEFMSQVEAFI